MLISVVLPAPLGPSKAKISPRRMSRLMFFSAWNPDAYTLERFEIEMTGCIRVSLAKLLARNVGTITAGASPRRDYSVAFDYLTYKVERLACSKPVSDRQPHLWGLLLLLR